MPSLKSVITFSVDEWKQIQPEEIKYKVNDPSRLLRSSRSYYVLPKGCWTPILVEHFLIHTTLPCCISFWRAIVLNDGNIYLKIIGQYTIYSSNFEGIISQKPVGNSRYVFIIWIITIMRAWNLIYLYNQNIYLLIIYIINKYLLIIICILFICMYLCIYM